MVTESFDGLDLPQSPPAFEGDEKARLITLADLGARCCSLVVRDRYKGDTVELVPEPESPGRLTTRR